MALNILPKRRSADATAPTTANMVDGEIAVNSVSKTIYQRVGANVIAIANYFSGAWADITGKPTTVAGFGISDAYTKTQVDTSLAGKANLTGTNTFNGAQTFGNGTGQVIVSIDSATSGTANGSAVYFKHGGSARAAIGDYSAIQGGAYDTRLQIWSPDGIQVAHATTIASTLSVSGTVVSGASSGDLRVGGQGAGNSATSFRYDGTMAAVASGTPGTYYTMWHAGNFDPNTKANVGGQVFTGTVEAPNLSTKAGTGNGYTTTFAGSGAVPGYMGFFSGDGTRRGYIGWADGSDLLLASENGWNWKVSGELRVGSTMAAAAVAVNNAGGAYFQGNGAGTQHNGNLYLNAPAYKLASNGAAWIYDPKVFVQSGDPGAQAADGDLWCW